MKLNKGVTFVTALVFCVVGSLSAQRARQTKKPTPPVFGTFYSLTLKQPPFPFNPFPELAVTQVEPGVYVYDDRQVDYLTIKQEQAEAKAATMSLLGEESGGGGMMMLMGGEGNTNLVISIPIIDGTNVLMTLVNTITNQPYDVFSTAAIGTTNPWTYLGRLPSGTTNFSVPLATGSGGGGAQVTTFNAADTADSDGDTLSDAIENLVTQTNPHIPDDTNSVPPGSIGYLLLTNKPSALYVQTFQRNYISLFVAANNTAGEGGTQSWARAVGGSGAQFTIFTEPPTQTNWSGIVLWDGAGNPTPTTSAGMPPNIWQFVNWHEEVSSPPGDPDPYTAHLDDDVSTMIELDTGGRALSTNEHLFKISVAAYDLEDWLSSIWGDQIPASDLTILGEQPDENGNVWKYLADNQKIDVTPVATTVHSNYIFDVTATKLKLKITRGGTDITDTMQTVWVGQPMGLLCELDPPIASLSNFNWTVPGNTISNWLHGVASSSMHTEFPKTNAGVGYYWIDESASLQVTVAATLNGHSVQAKATFAVRRPDASLRLTPKWHVEVSDSHCFDVPGTYLLTGRGCLPDNAGMLYEYVLNDLMGFPLDYEFQVVQLVTLHLKDNMVKVNNLERSREVIIRGLDTDYPYDAWPSPEQSGYTTDSPANPLQSAFNVYRWREDLFECYLMFKPSGGIPVPIQQAEWGWKGAALFQGNPGVWSAVSPIENPDPATGVDTLEFPAWTNNAANYNSYWSTNQYWFVP